MNDNEAIDSEAVESVELFWGQELSSKKKVYEYNGESDEEEGIETTLELRGACLGVNAKDERNVVNLTAEDGDGQTITCTILSLRLNKNEQVPLYLNIKPPVKLELVQGSGPISIVGSTTSVLLPEDDDMSGDEDDDMLEEVKEGEEESEEATSPVKKSSQKKKRPAESPVEKPAKKKKNSTAAVVVEDSDEDESDNEGSEDIASDPKLKKLKKKQEEEGDDDDNDSSEEDMSFNAGLVDDDDEEEEEEDSEEESEEELPTPPPAKKGNKRTRQAKGLSQTPVPKNTTKSSSSAKQPSSMPKETKSKSKAPPTIDQVKKRLLDSPALPKKVDKFNNMLKSNYKINDDAVKKDLWEFVQKNKK